MALFAQATQRALYQAIIADGTLAGLVAARVYDDIPEDEAFPYISLAAIEERDWSTSTEEGSDMRIQIDVWSRRAGRKEANQIVSALHELLHLKTLSVAGAVSVLLHYERSMVMRDSDGETWHGLIVFRHLSEPV